ncbi:hypothetical protein P20480_2807 [Pseudoalteromonas sp. BSi20480]|nr:hypothetical protein P20480_2807 [Pseudoalteromonas sp. BSi20480]
MKPGNVMVPTAVESQIAKWDITLCRSALYDARLRTVLCGY